MSQKHYKDFLKMLNCIHRYEYSSCYRDKEYRDETKNYLRYPLIVVIKCRKCGKEKSVSKQWCTRHGVENVPKVICKGLR